MGVFAFAARVSLIGRFALFASFRVLPLCFMRRRSVFWPCAGIRVMTYPFTRRPCAGRHLLFFAAAKKSRQKKAANTANISSCLRAPKGSYASHGNILICVRCQRAE
jgi:hypothetical protein